MKVLLVSPLPPPSGGIATWTDEFLNSDISRKNHIEVINIAIKGNRVNELTKKNIFDEIKRNISIFSDVKNKFKKNKYDLAHINSSCSKMGIIRDYLIAKYLHKNNIKIIVQYHCDTKQYINTKKKEKYFVKLSNIADKIFVLNTSSKKHIKEITGIDSIIIPNFINDNIPLKDNEKIINNDIKNILFVGRITKNKGCFEIIQMAKRMKNINFKLIGSITEEIKQCKTGENVTFTGEVSKDVVIEEMKKSDLLLFPSYSEGFPLVILESMALGLPIITTPVGAIPDMLEDKGGAYIEINNLDDMEEKIESLRDKKLRENISKWNIKKVKECYCRDKVVEHIFQEYEKVIN